MLIADYLSKYWGLIVILGGLLFHLGGNVHLERDMVKRYDLIVLTLFVYSVTEFAESTLGTLAHPHVMRYVLTALNYSLVSCIHVQSIRLLFPQKNKLLLVPMLLNVLLCTVSIFTPIVFYFTSDNQFARGPLGYVPYLSASVYLLYLFYCLVRSYGRRAMEDFYIILYMEIAAFSCTLFPLLWADRFYRWFGTTMAMDFYIYYVFILHQFTKRDALTKLFNRQSYYADIEKRSRQINALIALDMNGLKELNDNHGHTAGDAALAAIGDAMQKSARSGQRMYRIGGDEFAVLCFHNSREDVEHLVERLRENLGKTPYTCSIGYCYTDKPRPVDDLYKDADQALYVEKTRYYELTGKNRRRCG